MVASQLRRRMDDSVQQRLFAETPGRIEPPEEGLYLRTSGWSYADWEGTRHPHLKMDRDDDLLWWSDLVDRLLVEDRTVFAHANNQYQNHSPSTVERFLELRR
jgi:uncharacterized protein YecE (DUF72 family)